MELLNDSTPVLHGSNINILLPTNFQKCRDVYLLSAATSKTSMISYSLWQKVAQKQGPIVLVAYRSPSFQGGCYLCMYTCLLEHEIPTHFNTPNRVQYVNECSDESQQFEYSLRSIYYFPTSFLVFFRGLWLAWRTMKYVSNNSLLKLRCNNYYTLVSIIIDFTFSCSSQGFFCREFHSLLFLFISFIPIPFSVFYVFPNSVSEKRLHFSKRKIQMLCKFQWMIKGRI